MCSRARQKDLPQQGQRTPTAPHHLTNPRSQQATGPALRHDATRRTPRPAGRHEPATLVGRLSASGRRCTGTVVHSRIKPVFEILRLQERQCTKATTKRPVELGLSYRVTQPGGDNTFMRLELLDIDECPNSDCKTGPHSNCHNHERLEAAKPTTKS
jgi:hypothetical protein